MWGLGNILFSLAHLAVSFAAWEVNTLHGNSYSPSRFAISVEEHNEAFSTAAYCVDAHDSKPNGLVGSLCDACAWCAWKLREGFTTESEWQQAVVAEMDRLEGVDSSSQVVGSWIAEAPLSMPLSKAITEQLASSLGVSLDHLVTSGSGTRRFFVVSGTPSDVAPMLSVGFSSLTPIPPRLKIHPLLEHAAGDVQGGGLRSGLLEGVGVGGMGGGLHTVLTAPKPSLTTTTSSSSGNNNNNLTTSSGERLVSAWCGAVATHVGHNLARVTAETERLITVAGLTSREQYSLALELASGGKAEWIGPSSTSVQTTNFFAGNGTPPFGDGEVLLAVGNTGFPSDQSPSGGTDVDGTRNGNNGTVVLGTKRKGGEKNEKAKDREKWQWESPLHELGLTGEGQVVGIADSGIDALSCFFEDPEVGSPTFQYSAEQRAQGRITGDVEVWNNEQHYKIRQYVAYGNGVEDEAKGHGTHVAGSAVGRPKSTSNLYSGVAPDAKVAFFDLQDGDHISTPQDLGQHLFKYGYEVDARIFSMSLSTASETHAYGPKAVSLDKFLWEKQDSMVVVAAGNNRHIEQLSRIDEYLSPKVASPSIAKNAVSVGSHRNLADYREKSTDPPYDHNFVSRFSAVGPTRDGRYKPDVCGPGERGVWSAKSTAHPSSESCEITRMKGTSMATPIVAGASTLVRQYFMEGFYPDGVANKAADGFTPMGALLKAILVNSGQWLKAVFSEELTDLPAYDQGWGGVDLSTTLVTPLSHPAMKLHVHGKWGGGWCDECPQIAHGKTDEWHIKMASDVSGFPLKVTLVWFDHPGDERAEDISVNNLDLTVDDLEPIFSPPRYYPNGAGAPDPINTVEHINVVVPTPGGRYTVKVHGKHVPKGPQPYALVISGPFESVQETQHAPSNNNKRSRRNSGDNQRKTQGKKNRGG